MSTARVELPQSLEISTRKIPNDVQDNYLYQTMINKTSLTPESSSLHHENLKIPFGRSISEPNKNSGLIFTSMHPLKKSRKETNSSTTAATSLPTSPCSEILNLQRNLLLKNASTINSESLATKLSSENYNKQNSVFILIDCRPFISYNVSHISGAINVSCCDRFNRKRLRQGKATLADLATTKEGKQLLKERTWKEVVVYDDSSESLETIPASHTLYLVLNTLVEDERKPVMLIGGLQNFQLTFWNMCESHLMSQEANKDKFQKSTIDNDLLPELPSPSDLCHKTKDIENYPITKILPYLFLGNMRDASDKSYLNRLGIKYILNVSAKSYMCQLDPNITYKQLKADDNGVQNLIQYFDEAFQFIDLAKNDSSKGSILIHCHAGVSRSPTIAIAYIMKHYPMTLTEAYKFVKRNRSIISPNLNFMGQLWEYELGLNLKKENYK